MKAVSVLEHFSDHGSINQKMKKNTASVRSYPNSAGDGKTPYEEGLVFFHLKLLQGISREARGHQLEDTLQDSISLLKISFQTECPLEPCSQLCSTNTDHLTSAPLHPTSDTSVNT
ncbi:hypothetical protein TNCV_4722211 [Trichonephila clavipes]|uniref:Uncharacterized protein n=1 Tax=Trichonephila clavipes TaxID=2585209 RepID=A0A8X6W6A5_TRICX|nr:hypothetical protein TNCV_4722211 [Trichonephila clavipes]